MRWIAAVVLVSCGGTAPVQPTDPATASAEVLSLGLPCTPSQPECPTGPRGAICGNDRFGWTCVAYCTDAACAEPGTTCMARVGAADGMTGFCWKACGVDADCASALRCRDGVCGPH